MSTLKALVEARKAEMAPIVRCVEKEYHPVAMITFYPWQAKVWALPWSRLDGLVFSHEGEKEQIEFIFPQHHVVAVGENLQGTLDLIRTFLVQSLRALPVSHRVNLKPTEPFIERLDVRPLAEPKG